MEPTSTPRPNNAASDYDEAYTFGRPVVTYLALREVVRLTIFRSKFSDRQVAASDLDAVAG